MPMIVRPAVSADRPALRELFLRSRRETFTWQPCHLFQLSDFDTQTEGEAILVADVDGALAGFVSVWEPEAFIHHLYVDRAFLRRGVGHRLLRSLPGWPDTVYRLKCLCRNEVALRFYEAEGFVDAGRGSGDDGDYVLLASTIDKAKSSDRD